MAAMGVLQLTAETLATTAFHLTSAYSRLLEIDTASRAQTLGDLPERSRRFADRWTRVRDPEPALAMLSAPPPHRILVIDPAPHVALSGRYVVDYGLRTEDAFLFAIASNLHAHKLLHGLSANAVEWNEVARDCGIALKFVGDLTVDLVELENREQPYVERTPRLDRRWPRIMVNDGNPASEMAASMSQAT